MHFNSTSKCFDRIVVQFKMQISFEKFAHHLVLLSFFKVEKLQIRPEICFEKKLMEFFSVPNFKACHIV